MKRRRDTTYQEILSNPESIVPLLSQGEIKETLIATVSAYRDAKIDLKTAVKIAHTLKQSKIDSLSPSLKNIIDDIDSMSTIDDVFDDILEELREN